jgi:hypothetical protein
VTPNWPESSASSTETRHASFATIRKYLRDVYQLQLSRDMLTKVINKVSEAIAPLYESLFGAPKV